MSDYDTSRTCRACGLKTLECLLLWVPPGEHPVIECRTCGWQSADGSKRPSDEEKKT